jgi:outer membrane receptor protein involved in Fe transport
MALPLDLRAQTTTAMLRGKASDQQGAALTGVTVTARQVDTNTNFSVISSDVGQYFLPNLPPGRYEVSAELQGFRIERRTDLVLQLGQELTIDVTLRAGAPQETVTVAANTPILETTANSLGTIITKDDIDDLPAVERDFSSLARLAAGVTPGVGGNGDSLSMNGQRGFSNGYFIDGATAEWQYYGKQSSTMVQDWIQEFQVMTNSFSAEFGTASGGILNVITRSGTNRYHGRAYGFFRDAKLDSAPFAGSFENGKPSYLDEAAPFNQQRVGAFVGGPIVKDRLFFFAGAERLTKNSSTILGISDYWRAQGIETVLPSGTGDHSYLVKSDLNANNKNRISVRYDRSVRKDLNLSQSGSAIDTKEDRYAFGGPIWNVLANYTTTLSNSSFNEARFFFGSNKAPIVCNKSGTGGSAQLAQAPVGTFAHIEYPGALFGCPTFTGLEGEENIVLADNLSMSSGRHHLKIGAQGNQVRTIIDVTNYHDGFWSHPTDRLFNRADPTTYPDAFIGNVGPALSKTNLWNSSYYIQDTWQAMEGLTLNLGLRYDVDHSVTAGNDYVDAKNARIIQRYGGTPLLQKTKVDYNNFAPRVGFVWTPARDRRTMIRASGGIFYDQNHNNFNAIYIVNTLLSDGLTQFDANNPLTNPFFDPADAAGSAAALRAFLASNYPFFPDLSVAPAAPEVVDRLDPNLKVPFTAQYSGGMSHIFGGLTVQADYVHADGKGMPVFVDDNIKFENGVYSSTDPRFARILTLKNVGTSRYDALLTQAEYRWRNGHSGVSYTLSRATSNNDGGIFGGAATNPFDLTEDQGPDSSDRRHNFVFNGSYILPFDVQVAGIAIYRSAAPYSVTTRFQLDSDPFKDRPEPRNSRRGDSESTVDLRLSKIFRIGALRITGFWEMFNALNTDNFINYSGSLQSSSFAQPLAALDKRRQQFGFRVDF